MELRRSAQAVYELKYHLVWTPKYRAKILGGEVSQYLKEVFERISVVRQDLERRIFR
jgi:REP element-mobilizing transposase RayT